MFVCVYTQECWCLHRPEVAVRSPRASIMGECRLPDMGAGKIRLLTAGLSSVLHLVSEISRLLKLVIG